MKNIFGIALIVLSVFLSNCSSAQNAKTSLTATEFNAKIKEIPNAPIIDVRTPAEYAEGHIKNAKNIDWNGNSFDKKTSKLDKSKPVFVYCLAGGRSAAAASKLRESGFKQVYELAGGMKEWRASKLPEVK